MARESLTIGGINLMGGVDWDVDELTIHTPPPVGENPTVPGRYGAVWVPKKHGPGSFTVSMWIGNPGWTPQQARVQWETLVAAIATPHLLQQVVWTLSDGATRTCEAQLVGQISPSRLGTRGYRAQMEFTVPGSYWAGTPGFAEGVV